MMTNLARVLTIALAVSLMLPVAFASEDIQSPAEKTNFQAGPTMYDDLMKFVYDLDAKSDLMQVSKVTQTLRGRDVALCIMSNPPIYQPSDIMGSDKPIVLIVNNVHGGETAGKEASLILMRDLLFGELRPLLDKVVVLNIPTINPDGAEVRRRTNEQGLDMNRDYLKLESQEIQALVTKVLTDWQPDIHVDTHHGGTAPYTLTYQTIMNPAGDAGIMKLANEMIVPRIRKELRAEDYDGFWYSGPRMVDGKAGWGPTSVEPRKQHVYSGLSNTVDFLFETPSGTHRVIENGTKVVPIPEEEKYKHQVRGEYIGLRELIRFAADEPALLRRTVREAKEKAIKLGADDTDDDQIVLEYEQVVKMEEEIWRDTEWEERQSQGGGSFSSRDRDSPVEYELLNLPVFTKFEPTRTTTRPWGYMLPPQMATIVPLLLDHDITVQKLIEPVSLEIEAYYATEMTNEEYFQGHYLNKVKAVKKTETIDFPIGSFFVPAGQPKSNLICYIFEPETNDNLITWGFLDTYLQAMDEEGTKTYIERMSQRRARFGGSDAPAPPGQPIPMYRLMKKAEIKGALAERFNTNERNQYTR